MEFAIKQLLEEIKLLQQEKIEEIRKKENINSYRSSDTKELFTALAKAQAEMEAASLNAQNPFFKNRYADLAQIVKTSRPALTKHGLSVLQPIISHDDGNTYLITMLAHASGQYIESRLRINPPKSDVQTLGSYITYLRRYSYAALVGIVTSDEDDDGETAVSLQRENSAVKVESTLYKKAKTAY